MLHNGSGDVRHLGVVEFFSLKQCYYRASSYIVTSGGRERGSMGVNYKQFIGLVGFFSGILDKIRNFLEKLPFLCDILPILRNLEEFRFT